MIELNDEYVVKIDRASSKGNQLKWYDGNYWYKADNNGYEGLSEYVISKLLEKSSFGKDEFVDYDLTQIKYKKQIFNGCRSKNFLDEGWQIITIQRLFDSFVGDSFMETIDSLSTTKRKIKYLVDSVISMTNLTDFGEYLYKLCIIDALYLNDDRHTHNIALIKKKDNSFDYCPIFDNGSCLLSDVKIDYPYSENMIDLIKEVKPKIIAGSFDKLLDVVEPLYGNKISFYYDEKDIDSIVEAIDIYDENSKNRVKHVLKYQKNKLDMYFKK